MAEPVYLVSWVFLPLFAVCRAGAHHVSISLPATATATATALPLTWACLQESCSRVHDFGRRLEEAGSSWQQAQDLVLLRSRDVQLLAESVGSCFQQVGEHVQGGGGLYFHPAGPYEPQPSHEVRWRKARR